MCLVREQKPRKNTVKSKMDDDTILYYKIIEKKDPEFFEVATDEMAYVVCFDGREIEVNEPGIYRLIAKPARVIWVNRVPVDIKVGVPKEGTGLGLGFHARLRLYVTQWTQVLDLVKGVSGETWIRARDLRNDLKEIALLAFKSIFNDTDIDSNEFRRVFNIKLNELVRASKLAGFTAVTSYFGFSNQCKSLEEVEKL